jgi:hypothetical protein
LFFSSNNILRVISSIAARSIICVYDQQASVIRDRINREIIRLPDETAHGPALKQINMHQIALHRTFHHFLSPVEPPSWPESIAQTIPAANASITTEIILPQT